MIFLLRELVPRAGTHKRNHTDPVSSFFFLKAHKGDKTGSH